MSRKFSSKNQRRKGKKQVHHPGHREPAPTTKRTGMATWNICCHLALGLVTGGAGPRRLLVQCWPIPSCLLLTLVGRLLASTSGGLWQAQGFLWSAGSTKKHGLFLTVHGPGFRVLPLQSQCQSLLSER